MKTTNKVLIGVGSVVTLVAGATAGHYILPADVQVIERPVDNQGPDVGSSPEYIRGNKKEICVLLKYRIRKCATPNSVDYQWVVDYAKENPESVQIPIDPDERK